MKIEISLCLPREAETVALVRSTVTNTLLMFGVTDECAEDVRLAVSEAATNVILHAGSADEYEITVTVDDEQCVIRVKNTGDGFDAASLQGVMPSTDSARGRGVAIMHAVMDAVDMVSTPEEGTVVHLVRDIQVSPEGPLARLRSRAAGG